MQLLHFVRLLRGEVALLADVLRDVVKFQRAIFKPLDELPITVANDAVRRSALIGIVGVMPEERPAALHCFAL